jgi:hypothetical protein
MEGDDPGKKQTQGIHVALEGMIITVRGSVRISRMMF